MRGAQVRTGGDFYFLPNLREISSTIFGRRFARTLSTMLAIAGSASNSDAASSTGFPPTVAAIAAVSRGEAGSASPRELSVVLRSDEICAVLASAAAATAAVDRSAAAGF